MTYALFTQPGHSRTRRKDSEKEIQEEQPMAQGEPDKEPGAQFNTVPKASPKTDSRIVPNFSLFEATNFLDLLTVFYGGCFRNV